MSNWKIDCKDVMTWCKEYSGPKFHAMLCDPPYHLTTITKRFGKENSAPAQYGRDGAFQRVSKGFMGSTWDGETGGIGVAFDPATWAALSEHLLPGAFIFVFGSSRGWHRLAVAIEDAGFVFHPSLMVWGWVNGSGFPKATRIDTQIDKRQPGKFWEIRTYLRKVIIQSNTSQREIKKHLGYPEDSGVVGHWVGDSQPGLPTSRDWHKMKEILPIDNRYDSIFSEEERNVIGKGEAGFLEANTVFEMNNPGYGDFDITASATDLARAWEGHRYGRQALKPAVEMIICAQKPYEGKPVECIVETGAGSLWIDGGRVGTEGGTKKGSFPNQESVSCYGDGLNGPCEVTDIGKGRWPPNFCLVHSPDCQRAGTKRVKGITGGKKPHAAAAALFPEKKNRPYFDHTDADGTEEVAAYQCSEDCAARRIGEQSGDTARFFPQFDWNAEVTERLENSDQVFYASKASRGEREAGLEHLPLESSLTEQVAEVRNQDRYSMSLFCKKCGKRNDYGCNCNAGWEQRPQPGLQRKVRNPHPCVKNLKLCRWLATLLLPPPEYAPRRIMIPFAGVMSEAIGAKLAGWEEIVGVEMSEEYCEIGEARMKFWSQFESREDGLKAAKQIKKQHVETGIKQITLF